MRLSEHFNKAVNESYIDIEKKRYEKLLPKIQEYKNIFKNGITFPLLRVNEDDSISYDGEIEIQKESYVDGTKKMPFKFKVVDGVFTLIDGYADKLDSLEGLPEKCADLNIGCFTHKPPSFFEGHFPKELHNLDLVTVSLQNCKFGIEKVHKKIELTVEEFGLKNFEGLPIDIPRLTLNFPSTWIRSFKGLHNVQVLQFWTASSNEPANAFGLGDLVSQVKSIYKIQTSQPDLQPGTPILSLFKIKGLKSVECTSMFINDCKHALEIVDKYLGDNDFIAAQEELIEAGLEQYAKSK